MSEENKEQQKEEIKDTQATAANQEPSAQKADSSEKPETEQRQSRRERRKHREHHDDNEQKVQELGQKLIEANDKYVRIYSEYENYRKRTTMEKADLILNGANLDARGVKRATQIPIEIGYSIARLFARVSKKALSNAEMLGLMVNDPNVPPEALADIKAKTLVITGTNDMIKEEHTRLIARLIPDSQLVLIEGDHFVANKCPEPFNRAVLEFLRN
jgi:pimeloyl-ACP methyl ester carboxylesterase